jgi:trans-aconitate methyltransferase
MPPDEAQVLWTGSHGDTLLAQSVGFTHWLIFEYQEIAGRLIRNATVLDFGCGWGRLIRLLYRYVDVDRIYGLDPWDESIRICQEHGVLGHLAISDWVPRALPFDGPFDLIYAFSVFTHLSEKTTHVALRTLRDYIADNGALAITIRPPEYWHLTEREEMLEEHNRHGFAFVPHERPPIDGDITYGDTSMAVDYIAQEFPYWKIVRQHTSREDPLQTFLMLVPA